MNKIMSNNCLVTRLKAVVNDDSLPIIETMQQFTLNAIAASGNNNMTVAQKLALNHFFYSIGAISNSGIYSKLQVLGLPFIGTSIDTALHNYIVGGSSPESIDSRLNFSNGSIVSTLSTGRISDCIYSISGKDNEAFQLLFGALDVRTEVMGEREYQVMYDGIYAKLAVNPYTEFANVALHNLGDEARNINTIAFNVSNSGNIKLCYTTSDGNTDIIIPRSIHIEELTGKDITKYVPLAPPTGSLKGFAYGSGLTNDEAFAFTQAFNTLIKAFNS